MLEFEKLTLEKQLEFIEGAVASFKSKELNEAAEPMLYYDTNNPDIAGRKKMYAASITEQVEGETALRAVAKENKFASNEKIASSFFRDITDSKAQYLAGEGADVNAVSGEESDAAAIAVVSDILGEQIKRHGQACLTDALVFKSGYAYMQVIDGEIRLQYVPHCEVKPYRDRTDALVNVLRYYKRNGCEYAEYHTPAMIYAFKNDGDEWEFEEETPQIQTVKVYGDGTTEAVEGGKKWTRLPWFELWHNNDHSSSLTNAAKTMIRCYDITLSDFANNLIDVQDVFISLKDSYGSGGDWGEQLEMLKKFKVGENVEGVTTFEVPHVAREVLLNMLKADIYAALRGVDVGRISGGNLTNTAIRALYSDIDLWADQAEWHVKDWVSDIVSTAADYMGLTLPPFKVTLTRRAIFDDVAQMDALSRQKGVISDKTIYENHPLVSDAQGELDRVNAQELDAAYSGGI
jgi:SPP1 family phage portal protein